MNTYPPFQLSIFFSPSSLCSSETSHNFLCSIFVPLLLLEESLRQLSSGVLFVEEISLSLCGVKIEEKMNECGYEEKKRLRSCEEMRMESVVCPKPRRLGLLNHDNHIRPFRPQIINSSYQSEVEDWGVREELLDIILPPKGRCYSERFGEQVESLSPAAAAAGGGFYCGSPPSRASNPVIQDEHFCNMAPSSSPTPSSASRGCVRIKFGHTAAAVRIEGFDCLNRRDGRNCSISAVA